MSARLAVVPAGAGQPRNAPRLPILQHAYRAGENCRCPGCGARSWQVGRVMAECAVCATALPIVAEGVAS